MTIPTQLEETGDRDDDDNGYCLASMYFSCMVSMNTASPSLKKRLKREQIVTFFADLPPSLIGIKACGSALFWANKLQGMGA